MWQSVESRYFLWCIAFCDIAKRSRYFVLNLPHLSLMLVIVLGIFIVITQSQSVLSGALPQDQGKGLSITTLSFMSGRSEFNIHGRLSPTASYTKLDATTWTEYGLQPWLTYVGQTNANAITQKGSGNPTERGIGLSATGLRALLFEQNSLAFSVQGMQAAPGHNTKNYPRLAGLPNSQTELRFMGGYYQNNTTMPYFVDIEGAFQWRSGTVLNEWHGDLTFGIRPRENILLLAQIFGLVSTHQNGLSMISPYTNVKTQASFVYDINETWSAQLGAFISVAGTNSLRERGVIMAIWRRF